MPADRRPLLRVLLKVARVAPLALLLGAVLPGAASAAPQAATGCFGGVAPDPAASPTGDPNLMAYHFRCDGPITAYTVVVNRTPYDFEVIDDFSTTADVTTAGAIVPTESFGCEGLLPGTGVNCNGKADAYFDVSGTFDTSDPFCGGYAPGAKWPAKPAPAAIVQLVVTDATGAQDGPFLLNVKPACKQVKPLPKPKPKKHKKPKHHP